MSYPYKIHAVFFDFDGTLFDTWPALQQALENTFTMCYSENAPDFSKLKPFLSLPRNLLLKKALGKSPSIDEIDYYLNIYQHLMIEQIKPYEGVIKLLSTLSIRKIIWGVITNKSEIHLDIFKRKLPYLNKADCIICPESVINKKPHPEPLLKACTLTNTKPENAIYVGDTASDIQAAKSCGMSSAFACYGYSTVLTEIPKPDHKINQIKELYAILNI